MERIQELLARITELSDEELNELRDLILNQIEGGEPAQPGGEPDPNAVAASVSDAQLEELAEAATAVQAEFTSRANKQAKTTANRESLAKFKTSFSDDTAPAESTEAPTEEKPAEETSAEGAEDKGGEGGTETSSETDAEGEKDDVDSYEEFEVFDADGKSAGMQKRKKAGQELGDATKESSEETVTAGAKVPEDRQPRREVARTTVIRAGADLPGWALGQEITSESDMAQAVLRRIDSMRGIRGGDGDKLIVASAELTGMSDEFTLKSGEAEANLQRIQRKVNRKAITAAGGLAAPEESKYDLYGVGIQDRPVRGALPVFKTDRGGVRFMKPPTLNDVNGVVGIWTVQNDIDAATNPSIRKPSFRVLPGPEVVVDTQAITMIMTFGNMMARAYPELVARHNELGLIAHARVAEQQLLTQIGALSTKVTGNAAGTQVLSATRTVLAQIGRAAASYRNRHRLDQNVPMKAFMPLWFLDMLREDVIAQHPGDGLEVFAIAESVIANWFSSRSINITWTLDGEAGQDYAAITDGNGGLAKYPTSVIWYLYAEGTFAFMDNGTLDLGLVRDSTLNAANDYQMFVETFENVVMFGNESLRVRSYLTPTGQGSADKALS